jgi:hypothetical protein
MTGLESEECFKVLDLLVNQALLPLNSAVSGAILLWLIYIYREKGTNGKNF